MPNYVMPNWQDCVNKLVGTGSVATGIILGLSDGGIWASRPANPFKPGEVQAILILFKNPANIFASGTTIGGVKYTGIQGDAKTICGKQGTSGVAMVKTAQTVVIGLYNSPMQPGAALAAVQALANQMLDSGY